MELLLQTVMNRVIKLGFAIVSCLLMLLSSLFLVGCVTKSHSDATRLSVTNPSDQKLTTGQTAHFSTLASGNIGTVTFQWLRNGVPIGGSSSTLTIPAVSTKDSGAHFSIRAQDSIDTVTSDPALLTVTPFQTILNITPISSHSVGDAPFAVSATSNSPAVITFSIVSGPAYSQGSLVSISDSGTVVVQAEQAAVGEYSSAIATTSFNVRRSINISAVSPADMVMGPGSQIYSAVVTGGLTNQIVWSASDGSFNASLWRSPDKAGTYTITATSAEDPGKTASTSVRVSPPVITKQPVSRTVCPGVPLQLDVQALYAQSYAWKKADGTFLGTSPTLQLPGVLTSGSYQATATNPAGSVDSQVVDVNVGSTIITDPQSVTVGISQTARFAVVASGMAAFTYQWYIVHPGETHGSIIVGAVEASYSIPNVTESLDGTSFYVQVKDSCNSTLVSQPALLTVEGAHVPPTISRHPLDMTVPVGATATYNVTATGSPTLLYKWYKVLPGSLGGTLLPDAQGQTFTTPPTTMSDDQSEYYVVVSNPYGQATSRRANLSVGAGISILQQPVSVHTTAGSSVAFSVVAQSALPLTYQWFTATKGSSSFTAIPGATSATLSQPNVVTSQDGQTYYVLVSNGVTSDVKSTTAALFVGELNSIAPCSDDWLMLGDASSSGTCGFNLASASPFSHGEIVWPHLLPTQNMKLSFTVVTSDATPVPADGYAIVFGDPTLGAQVQSQGTVGEGLGARGIPGLVVVFDEFSNNPSQDASYAQDPQVPYLAVGRGESALWENPYTNVNTHIPALAEYGQTIRHDYVITIVSGDMEVQMDQKIIFSGHVDIPALAYLYATASTGSYYQRTVMSSITMSQAN